MELKAELLKPYTEQEEYDFIVEQNHILNYEIKETETALQAWGLNSSEELQKAKEEKYSEALLGAKNYIENEAVYQFDENNSIEATDGNIGKMTAYALGFQTGTIENVSWTSKEDNVLILNAEDVLRILEGLGQIQAIVWNIKFVTYKNAIENAQTVEEVQNINIDYSLPIENSEVEQNGE